MTRRLAAIMFTDVVGYSELSHRDEGLAIELLEMHRRWVRELLPLHGGREISTIGDAFLVEFGGALAAVECALAVQRRFAGYNASAAEGRRIELRIGIHLGDIEHREGNVLGDGVNLASRIHGMAESGGICVSEQVHLVVRNRAGLRFRSLGRPKLKNISTALQLYAVDDRAPAASSPARQPVRARRALAAGLALAAAAVAVVIVGPRLGQALRAEVPSVAVLPFENLSAEPDSAFFTDGLHDTVIGHLARIKDLKVISRTSVMGYRDRQANLREIAAQLGVAHIVEASVQRNGTRLRVVAQLIDARTDAHVWSNEYERDVADAFAVQADLARQVAEAVHARLTPRERENLARGATRNPAAYDLYLKALLVQRGWAHLERARVFEGAEWVDQAIALDPGFAPAHALATYLHDALYWDGLDPTAARHQRAIESASTALRLDPLLTEAHVAQALVLYHDRRYADAVRELEIARDLSPGSSEVQMQLVAVYRREGRWDEALAAGERGAWLDPLNPKMLEYQLAMLQGTRRYAEADAVLARLLQVGDPRRIPLRRAENRFWMTGDLDGFEEAARALAATHPDDGPCFTVAARATLAGLRKRYDEAVAAALSCRESYPETPQEMWVALAYHDAGNAELARQYAGRALSVLSSVGTETANSGRVKMNMALAHAAAGDRASAVREADAALRTTPATVDAVQAPEIMLRAAMVFAMTGEHERALDLLEQTLSVPFGAHAHQARLDPAFAALRGNPRFEQIIGKYLPRPPGT